MLEKTLETKIIKKAKELGFLIYKFSSPSNRGVPDRIFICPGGEIFFIEFKSSKGKLSKLQEHQIKILRDRGVCVYVVCDLDTGLNILNGYIHSSSFESSDGCD